MKRQRIQILMHEHLVPPDDASAKNREGAPWMTEFDVVTTLRELGHEVEVLPVADELPPIRRALEAFQPDVAFNLLTFFHNVATYDAYVVSFLELLKVAYTGANPRGIMLCGDKALSKKVMSYHRIPVPRFAVFRWGKKAKKPARLSFPLIVKSTVEHASAGISQASIVHDDGALAERVEFVHRNLGTDAIAEQFIPGRELTVSVMGNDRLTAFPVWEMTFENLPEGNARIATAKVKWDLEYQKKVGVLIGPAQLTDAEAARIQKLAKRVYKALDLTGFARIDLRLADDGQVFVLEANPNPQIARGEEFAEAAKFTGLDYPSLLQRIVSLGIRYQPEWKD